MCLTFHLSPFTLQVVAVAHTFVEVWESVAGLLAELDVLLGFADLAVTAPSRYVRPTILPAESGEITLIGSRHPCVEALVGHSMGTQQAVMPNTELKGEVFEAGEWMEYREVLIYSLFFS